MDDSLVAIHDRSPVFFDAGFNHNGKGREVQQAPNIVNFPNCVLDGRGGYEICP